MCNGHKCAHCEQEERLREKIAKKIIEKIMCLDRDMDTEEFTTSKLELIRLVNDMV